MLPAAARRATAAATARAAAERRLRGDRGGRRAGGGLKAGGRAVGPGVLSALCRTQICAGCRRSVGVWVAQRRAEAGAGPRYLFPTPAL